MKQKATTWRARYNTLDGAYHPIWISDNGGLISRDEANRRAAVYLNVNRNWLLSLDDLSPWKEL
jgi:hypothetical protein